MATATSILEALDALAKSFEFPGFNNMNYDTADARLHCYRDGDRWALVVEELVDWPAADGLMTLAFAMGDIADEALHTRSSIETVLEDLEDPDSVPETIVLRGASVAVDRDALAAACEEHEIEPTLALLLQLMASHRDALFYTEAELDERVAKGLKKVMKLDEWAHPDVYGGPKPSASEAFQQLAEVLASGDVGKYAPTEAPNNRDWKTWLEEK